MDRHRPRPLGAVGWGAANDLASLGSPATAGTGAFGGVLSTPYGWVFADTLVTLILGCGLGLLSVKLTGLLTPAAHDEAPTPEPAHLRT